MCGTMRFKGVAVATGFISTGFVSLFIYYFIQDVSYTYLLFTYALMFILGGVTIFAKLTVQSYRVEKTEFAESYELLSENAYFYVLEVAKVVSVLLLTYFYPLETFGLWVIIDCLDGFSLPYKKRSLTLRHQIDKFTDFVCMISFYLYAIRAWPALIGYFSFLFMLALVKTIGYISSGNRDVLVYIPNIFAFVILAFLVMQAFYPAFLSIFIGDAFYLLLFSVIILLACAAYEFTYNGVFIRFRYLKKRRGWE